MDVKRLTVFDPEYPRNRRENLIQSQQIYLRQMNQAGNVWSDGKTLLTGDDLRKAKAAVVDRIINLRTSMKAPKGTPGLAKDYYAWKSLDQLMKLRRAHGSDQSVLSSIQAFALHPRPMDTSSIDRKRVATRAIRRHFPGKITQENCLSFTSNAREREHLAESMGRKMWMLKEDLRLGYHLELKKDMLVQFSARDRFHVQINGATISVPASAVRKVRARDHRRLSLEQDPEIPGFEP